MRHNIQTNIHNSDTHWDNSTGKVRRLDRDYIYPNIKPNLFKKMPATIGLKILYFFGFLMGGLAFVTNLEAWIEGLNTFLHGAVTIILGILGIVFLYWRIQEKKADAKSKQLDNELKRFNVEDVSDEHKKRHSDLNQKNSK
jgi:hypothetical protein